MRPVKAEEALTKVVSFSVTKEDLAYIEKLAKEDKRFCENGRSATLRRIISFHKIKSQVYEDGAIF